jgi:hypothetical protein
MPQHLGGGYCLRIAEERANHKELIITGTMPKKSEYRPEVRCV